MTKNERKDWAFMREIMSEEAVEKRWSESLHACMYACKISFRRSIHTHHRQHAEFQSSESCWSKGVVGFLAITIPFRHFENSFDSICRCSEFTLLLRIPLLLLFCGRPSLGGRFAPLDFAKAAWALIAGFVTTPVKKIAPARWCTTANPLGNSSDRA